MFDIEPENTPGAMLRRMLLLLLAALVMAFGIAARADTVRLYDQIGVESPSVTLAQVAQLEGPSAKALGHVVLATLDDSRSELTVTLDQVQAALDQAGVNWGLVSLRGFNACRVTRLSQPPEPILDRGQAVAANIETPIGLGSALTLRGLLEQRLAEHAGVPRADLRIRFSDHDVKRLDIPILGRTVEIEPGTVKTLGRVPVVLRLYDAKRIAETIRVNAQVQRVLLAVVADGPIARGEVFTRDRLKVQESTVDDDAVVPITDPGTILGQESSKALRTGEMISMRMVKSPVMVKRGELVDVRCFVGGLIVRTVGRAAEKGSVDDLIRIRNESNGEYYLATVTGRQQAVIASGAARRADASALIASSHTQQEATP